MSPTKVCQRCRESAALPDSKYCNDCGAELYDEWRADQAAAEHDALAAAEPAGEPNPDVPF